MNILLSGPPFSGKTTIGDELARQLGWPLVNTDTLLEEKYGMGCPEQYKQFGNEGFRKNEYLLLNDLSRDNEKKVYSLGGGTLTYEPNARIIKSLGFLVVLQCSFDILYSRVLNSGRTPSYLDANNKEESFKKLLEDRKKDYDLYSDFTIDVSNLTPSEAAELVVKEYLRRLDSIKEK